MSAVIHITLAGGRQLYREALRAGLERLEGLHVIHAADLPRYEEIASCDVLVANASSLTEYELEEIVGWLNEGQKALLVGQFPSDCLALLEALLSGRLAWLEDETSLDVMATTVRRLAAGEPLCSPQVLAFVAHQIQLCQRREPSDGECPTSLTERQREIATLVAEGLINKQIARQLDIRVTTVKSHVHDLMRKYQVKRREDLRRCVARSHTR